MITAEHFTAATGAAPVQDDLERSNCGLAGTLGHSSCGWDAEFDLPVFMVGRDEASRDWFRQHAWPAFKQST